MFIPGSSRVIYQRYISSSGTVWPGIRAVCRAPGKACENTKVMEAEPQKLDLRTGHRYVNIKVSCNRCGQRRAQAQSDYFVNTGGHKRAEEIWRK